MPRPRSDAWYSCHNSLLCMLSAASSWSLHVFGALSALTDRTSAANPNSHILWFTVRWYLHTFTQYLSHLQCSSGDMHVHAFSNMSCSMFYAYQCFSKLVYIIKKSIIQQSCHMSLTPDAVMIRNRRNESVWTTLYNLFKHYL